MRRLPELPAAAPHLCPRTRGLRILRDGVFADYVVLPATAIWQQRPGVDLDTAALFDPFGNAVHAAHTFALRYKVVAITCPDSADLAGALRDLGRCDGFDVGMEMSGQRIFDTWHQVTTLLDAGIRPAAVITHHFPADDYATAFEVATSTTAGKVMLVWSPEPRTGGRT